MRGEKGKSNHWGGREEHWGYLGGFKKIRIRSSFVANERGDYL